MIPKAISQLINIGVPIANENVVRLTDVNDIFQRQTHDLNMIFEVIEKKNIQLDREILLNKLLNTDLINKTTYLSFCKTFECGSVEAQNDALIMLNELKIKLTELYGN